MVSKNTYVIGGVIAAVSMGAIAAYGLIKRTVTPPAGFLVVDNLYSNEFPTSLEWLARVLSKASSGSAYLTGSDKTTFESFLNQMYPSSRIPLNVKTLDVSYIVNPSYGDYYTVRIGAIVDNYWSGHVLYWEYALSEFYNPSYGLLKYQCL